MSQNSNLDSIRREIDRIDGKILQLLSQRAKLALKAGRAKRASGRAITDPAREKEVLEARVAVGAPPLPVDAVRAVFSEIIEWCRYVQEHDSDAPRNRHNSEDVNDGHRHG